MTSNLGSSDILEGHRENVEMLLHQTFKPEFLNRIDEIVYFNPLNKDTQLRIVDKMLELLKKRLNESYYSIEFSNSLKRYILDSSYSETFGARPIKRFIQNEVETLLANLIISEQIDTKHKYLLDYVDNKVTIKEM
jgi:ATP-dependent Clp protease ATP-binding subunit ClpB